MKIVFLCGCIEPGQDGVGDYTRRLAAELQRQQHRVNIIAIHDRRVTESALIDTQSEEEQTIPVLRLSNQLSWRERTNRVQTYIDTINPDWISLQYVPFSFHNKGLSVRLLGALRRLSAGRSMHIMFHEIWVGLSKQASTQHVLWGRVQRQLIRSLCSLFEHPVIHTHTPLYQIHLSRLGVQASILPLFSNIRVVGRTSYQQANDATATKRIRLVFFGGISPNAPVMQLAAEVTQYAIKTRKTVELTIIGRSGPEQKTWVSAWRSSGLAVHLLGEQSPEQISEVLSQSTIGISTTPMALAGKSGAIAAMHTHGLPVLCVAAPWQPRENISLTAFSGTVAYAEGALTQAIECLKDFTIPTTSIESVANQMMTDLIKHRSGF